MGKRKQFYLIFTQDPPARDIVREDFVLDVKSVTVGSDCTFRWERRPNDFEEVQGKCLMIGLKKNAEAVHINAEGHVVAAKDLGTRKQELEKKRFEQANAQKLQLQSVAENLLNEGPDAVAETLQPLVKVRAPCLPKKRSGDVMERLEAAIKDMPCFTAADGKQEISRGTGVYCSKGKLMVARLKYRLRPADHHRALLKLVLPQNILRLEGISATGKRGCLGIPSIIHEAIGLYVAGVYQQAGGKVEDIAYDPVAVCKNLMDNTRKLHGKWSYTPSLPVNAPPSPQPSTSSESLALLSTQPSSPAHPSSAPSHSSTPPNSSAPPPTPATPSTPGHEYATLTDISFNRPSIEVTVPYHSY